jgi:hypothetical protein
MSQPPNQRLHNCMFTEQFDELVIAVQIIQPILYLIGLIAINLKHAKYIRGINFLLTVGWTVEALLSFSLAFVNLGGEVPSYLKFIQKMLIYLNFSVFISIMF